jgi:hypothetical protein
MLSSFIRAAAVLGALSAALASGTAAATPLVVGNSVTTADGTVFTLLTCSTYGCTAPNVGQFTLAAGQRGIVITGNGGGPIEGVSGGSISTPAVVDTFLKFSVTSALQNVSSLSFNVTACGGTAGPGGNPGVINSTACPNTVDDDVAGTTIKTYRSDGTTQLAQTSLSTWNDEPSGSNVMSGTQTFSAQQTVYVTLDLAANAAGGYSSYDSVVFSLNSVAVPEPASGAVFVLGLAGLAALRRRRA